jgi:hypothetical protein
MAAACAARAPAVEAPRAEPWDASNPRHVEAVVLERAPATPTPVDRALAGGVVALRQPIAVDEAVALVRAWMAAWQGESIEALTELLAASAVPLDGAGHGRSALVESLRQRLQVREYTRLAGLDLVREDRLELLSYDELNSLGTPPRPPMMQRGDAYVRAPLELRRAGDEHLFGEVLVFVLRVESEGAKPRIVAYGEVDER